MPAKNGILKGTGRGEAQATMVTCIVAGVCRLGGVGGERAGFGREGQGRTVGLGSKMLCVYLQQQRATEGLNEGVTLGFVFFPGKVGLWVF